MKADLKDKQGMIWGIVVAAVTAICYLTLLKNDFVLWDDDHYVIDNPHIRILGWSFIKWSFTTFVQGNWHPLTFFSHALDYAWWGLNPAGHHLTSLLIHAANTFLVVILVARMVQLWKKTHADDGVGAEFPATLVIAVTAGLLFGIHPLHVESVAWVSERKDLLCGFFYLCALFCYCSPSVVRLRPKVATIASVRPLQAALFFSLLALMSKPMAVTLPLVLVLCDRYLLSRIGSRKDLVRAVMEKVPYVVPAIGIAIATLLAQKSGMTTNHAEMMPFLVRLLVGARSLLLYLLKMLAPLDLSPVYPYPLRDEVSLAALSYLVPLLLVVSSVVLLIRFRKQCGWWQPLVLYYIFTILPVIGLVQVGAQAMADRYTYLPSLGPFIFCGVGVAALWQMVRQKRWRHFVLVVGLCYGSGLIFLTQIQIGRWKNSLVFWSSIIAEEPVRIPFAYTNRGVAYHKMGELDKALVDLNRAVELAPGEVDSLTSRGAVLMDKGNLDQAIADFTKAISLNIADSSAYYNRAMVLGKLGQGAAALDDYGTALKINPGDTRTLNSRGQLLQQMGEFEKAMADFNAALAVDPADVKTFNNRGLLLMATGELDRAVADFDAAILVHPKDAVTHINRGLALSAKGDSDRALADLDQAIGLKPDESRAFNNRGIIRAQKGLRELAVADFNRALELNPRSAEAYVNRGLILLQAGDGGSARKDFAQACQLGEKRGCALLQ